eukprot:1159099-Pelagomonas_calceolata.AAC.9
MVALLIFRAHVLALASYEMVSDDADFLLFKGYQGIMKFLSGRSYTGTSGGGLRPGRLADWLVSHARLVSASQNNLKVDTRKEKKN